MPRKIKPSPYELLLNEIFAVEPMNDPWRSESYVLDEYMDRPTPDCLVKAGWKVTTRCYELPHNPGVYIIHCGQKENYGLYLYVGQALNLANRFRGHLHWFRAKREFSKPLVFYWDFSQINKRQLLRFEAYMIGATDPIWNFGEDTKMCEGLGEVSFNDFWND